MVCQILPRGHTLLPGWGMLLPRSRTLPAAANVNRLGALSGASGPGCTLPANLNRLGALSGASGPGCTSACHCASALPRACAHGLGLVVGAAWPGVPSRVLRCVYRDSDLVRPPRAVPAPMGSGLSSAQPGGLVPVSLMVAGVTVGQAVRPLLILIIFWYGSGI